MLQLHNVPLGKHQYIRLANPRFRPISIIVIRQCVEQRLKLTIQPIAILFLDLVVICSTFRVFVGRGGFG
jgi:hypothetical protein